MLRYVNPLGGKTTDWRAGCGRPACPVRREGESLAILPTPILTPSQVLRSFVLKSVKSWDYRELRERIADGYTLRQFTEFYCQPVPKHHAFHSAFHRLTPETVKAINELVVDAAVHLGLEDGNTLRVDCTVDVATLCYTSLSL